MGFFYVYKSKGPLMKTRKPLFLLALGCLALGFSRVEAEDAAVAPAATSAVSDVAATGESQSLPAPLSMTDSSSSGVFLTLTRTAFQPDALPTSAETLRSSQFKTRDVQNAGDILARETGIQIARPGPLGTVRLAGIRGATSNQTLILLDGRPIGGVGLSASQDLAQIPVEQIDRIEIVRGGASALYGPNALGGVINIISKRSSNVGLPRSNVSYELRSFDSQTLRLDAGSRVGPVDYFFFGSQERASGFRNNSDARTANIGGNLGLAMGKGGKLLFDASSFHSNAGSPGQQFPDIPVNTYDNARERAASTPGARQVTDSQYGRASYLLPLPMNSMAAFRLFGSQRQVEYNDPTFGSNSDRHEQSKGAELQFDLPLDIVAGGTFIHDRLDSRDLVTPANNYNAWVENWGVFLQKTFCWKVFTAIPSYRYDHHSLVGESKNPRVQLIADATPWLRLSGSAARSFRAPTIDDLYTPFTNYGYGSSYQGNPNLKPEKAWSYDAGFEVHRDSNSFKATYYHSNVSNLIQTTSDLASTTINVGKARRRGVELELKHTLTRTLWHRVNYSYLEALGVLSGQTEFVNLRLSPKHTANYVLSWTPRQPVRWDNSFRYVGLSYEGNNRSSTRLDDHFTWDTRISVQIRQLEVYAGIENIAERRYRERGGFPLPGRTYFGGLSLRLWG